MQDADHRLRRLLDSIPGVVRGQTAAQDLYDIKQHILSLERNTEVALFLDPRTPSGTGEVTMDHQESSRKGKDQIEFAISTHNDPLSVKSVASGAGSRSSLGLMPDAAL
jgi:DNA repair ATPase RecN